MKQKIENTLRNILRDINILDLHCVRFRFGKKFTYLNASRMNTMCLDGAIKLRATIYILVLLKALTAYKVGRPDLVMKPSAFESSRYLNFRVALPKLAEDSGFLIFKHEK